jgi:hypothetical protein
VNLISAISGHYHWVSELAPASTRISSITRPVRTRWCCGPHSLKSFRPDVNFRLAAKCLKHRLRHGYEVLSLKPFTEVNSNFVFERQKYYVNSGISDCGHCLQHPGAMALPRIEPFSLFVHLGNLLVTVIPLLVLALKQTAKQVLTEVGNNGG